MFPTGMFLGCFEGKSMGCLLDFDRCCPFGAWRPSWSVGNVTARSSWIRPFLGRILKMSCALCFNPKATDFQMAGSSNSKTRALPAKRQSYFKSRCPKNCVTAFRSQV